ncbi:MAG: PD40 domain-containing protein [Sandaracinaceae bacterium]|nr:PD40 domain-containing protein [Sandaracinaceae bacterium]
MKSYQSLGRTIAHKAALFSLSGLLMFTASCASPIVGGECAEGFSQCHHTCVDTNNDPNNCGGCGIMCPTMLCSSGMCVDGDGGERLDGSDMSLADGGDGGGDGGGDAGDMGPALPTIIVSPTSGLMTSETGTTAQFSVVLSAAPTSDVTVSLVSSDETEGTVVPDSITFTSVNWRAPKIVTVTGVDDPDRDGSINYSIVTGAAVSADASYNSMPVDDVMVENVDDETPGFTISPLAGLRTSESGITDTFTIRLNTMPTADVILVLTSSDTGEVTVDPTPIMFTNMNWNSPQTVTVTGVDDSDTDGDQPFTIATEAATSADTNYMGLNPADVLGTNLDDETAGIILEPSTGLITTEAGGMAVISVVLQAQPNADVMIPVASSNALEGEVSTASIVFTMTNWSMPQVVTVTGVNDFLIDGNQPYQVVFGPAGSTDAAYNGLGAAAADLINVDDESSGITVTPIDGLITTEGGSSASFSVALASQPSGTVTIEVTSSNTLEGTVSPATLTFTPADWNMLQTVTVTGVDDSFADGPQPYQAVVHISASADPTYAALADVQVSVTNIDDEMAGVTVSPTTGLTTSETGATATFTIVLNSEPTAPVTIDLSSDLTSEATVDPISVTFNASNWNMPQTVTITGVNDDFADGDHVVQIITSTAVSGDPDYDGVDPLDVTVINMDDDHVGITVSPLMITTAETGPAVTFTVVLTSRPSADAAIDIHLQDATRASVDPSSILFDGTNWNIPQTVTVTPTDDLIANGDIVNMVLLDPIVSTGLYYNGFDPDDVAVTITDNETGSVVVTPTTGLVTSEGGASAMFSIVLTSQPTSSVTISLMSSDSTEGNVAPASVMFNGTNWNVPQNVVVTGVDDAAVDGDVSYSIITGAAASSDSVYGGLAVADVALVNTDDDVGGVTVSPTSGLTTTEVGGTAMFTVVLTAPPVADVVIPLSTSNPAEGDLMVAALTFTAMNWNVPQTVTVRGVDDFVQDGPVGYTIVTGATASASAGYNGLAVADVSLTNTDNDVAGITVSPTSGLMTSESGTSASFTIVLTSQPTSNVTINLSSSDPAEASVAPASVVFSSLNWNMAQTVTVMGVDDFVVDGSKPFTIVTAPAVSSGMSYSGRDAADVTGTNADNDVAGITVTPTAGLVTTETGASTTFTIVLTSQPTAAVTISLMSSDATEDTVAPASVVFTNADWNVPQTVTVTGVDDVIIDGNQVVTIVTGAASTTDINYSGLAVADVSVTNNDNDSANVIVTPTSGLVVSETGTMATFTMVLAAMPTASVAISLAVGDPTEATVSPASVTFTTLNWNVARTVTVTGIDDVLLDGDITFSIVTGACVSSDVSYSGRAVADVSVTNTDNEGGGVVVNPTSGLFVTEAGSTASFTVVLTIAPSANVTIALSSSNTAEASVSPNSVTFTVGNWNIPQVVTVTGTADAVIDGDQSVTIVTAATSSSQALYNGLAVADVTATVIDVDRQRCVSCDAVYLPRGGDVGGPVTTAVSSSGRYVAFMSSASNLVPADTNGATDLFVRDRLTGSITRESVNSAGVQSAGCNAASGTPSITPDGRYVVFSCSASDLVATDTNGNTDVFIRDRAIGATTLVSFRATNSNSCNGTSTIPTVTDDGRWVTFVSSCTNAVVSDTNGATTDLFVRDTVSAVNFVVSVDSGGAQLASATTSGSVAGSGGYFAFASAGAFVAGDTNGASDIYYRDFAMGVTTRVSLSSGGGDPTGGASITPSLSADGRYVVYSSTATNIVAGDTNGVQDIFVRDITGGMNIRASVDSSSVQAGAISQYPSITADGRYVAFQSSATNLVAGDANGFDDIFVRDLIGATTTLVSRAVGGAQMTGAPPITSYPSIAPDGSFVVFASAATNLITNDTNGVADVFAVPYL